MSSGPFILSKVTSELVINSHTIWRRFLSWVLINISLSNIMWKLRLLERFHQNCQAFFGATGMTLPMLRLISSKAQECKNLWKTSKPCHVCIHWIALDEYSQMSTHMPGFQSYIRFLHHFVLAILATSSIRVNIYIIDGWIFQGTL